MSVLEFIVRLIEAVAWPVAAAIIVFAFKGEIQKMLSLMRRFKAGPVEAEFEREVLEVKKEASESLTFEPNEVAIQDPESTRLIELARVSPRAAILEAWLKLEIVMRRAVVQGSGSPIPDTSSPLRLVKAVDRFELLRGDEVALLHDLRGLRNQAVHLTDAGLSLNAATAFIELARRLEKRLEGRLTVGE